MPYARRGTSIRTDVDGPDWRSEKARVTKPRLTLFDLDHTLLDGDSDVLWCDFLLAKGLLERAGFAQRNADIEARYKAGTVGAEEFAHFYLSTLAGHTPQHWEPVRREFLAKEIIPRIPTAALQLVQRHRDAQDLLVMTTATSRTIAELTAAHFGIEHLIATEPELVDGCFTGRARGVLNMRAGKVARLHAWLEQRGQQLARFHSTAYSDSINDLPLLEAVDVAVTVNADVRLSAVAAERGWRTIALY